MYNNIFDTHSHYDDERFENDIEELLNSLPKKGVSNIVSCGCDIDSSLANKRLAEKYDYLYFAAGFHPENLE
ncbi:MAG: TatD family hydrolase, partial [Eubacterium sp.]|nr:TatD family hydrolase [Eubacterium sp.]